MQKVQEMEAAVNPIRRIPSPPEPVDVSSPQWVARAWQWVFDRLQHLDECMDETKESNRDLQASFESYITSAATADDTRDGRLEKHLRDHELLDAKLKERRGVWKMQGEFVSKAFKLGTDGVVLAGFIAVLKWLGLL